MSSADHVCEVTRSKRDTSDEMRILDSEYVMAALEGLESVLKEVRNALNFISEYTPPENICGL